MFPAFLSKEFRINLHAALLANVKLRLKILSLLFVEAGEETRSQKNWLQVLLATSFHLCQVESRVSLSIALLHVPNAMSFPVESAIGKHVCNPLLDIGILASRLYYRRLLLHLLRRSKKTLFALFGEPLV